MSIAESEQRAAPAIVGLLPSIVVNAVFPIMAFAWLTGRGWSAAAALVATTVFPVAATLWSLVRVRSMDGLSTLSLIFIALGILGSLVSGNARFILAKESVLTGVFGLAFAVSLLLPRPLAFYFGRQFATGGDPVRVRHWNSLWQYPAFRRGQRNITLVWTASCLADAAVRLVLVFTLPIATMVWLSQVLLYAAVAGTLAWTITYANRARARAVAQYGQAAAVPAPTTPE